MRPKKNSSPPGPLSGLLALVSGQSRSGKSFWTAQRVAREPRLLVWDSMREFSLDYRCREVRTPAELHRVALSSAPARIGYAVPVSAGSFDTFCRLAWVWLRVNARAGHSVAIVVEEMADVTTPGKAPPAWGEIVRKGLRFGPRIYALTQRPAESDKTVVGNANLLHCHAMARADDARYMARELRVDPARVDALRLDRFEWLELDRRTRVLTAGGKGLPVRTVAAAQT